MTNFVTKNFRRDREYLHYIHEGEEIFIARSKYNGKMLTQMKRFLVKSGMTVQQWIDERNGDWRESAPLTILERYGFKYVG